MEQDNYIEEKKNSKKETFKNVLFTFVIGSSLLDNLTKWANDVILQLTGEMDVYGVLFWGDKLSINLIKVLLTAVVGGLIASIYAYLSRDRRLYIYLIMVLGTIYFSPLLILIITPIVSLIYDNPIDWATILYGLEADFYITLTVIQVALAVVTTKLGQKFGLELEYLDPKDILQNTIYGIKKFYWFLIIFPFNMLSLLAVVSVTRVISKTMGQLISGQYSGGFEGIMTVIFFPMIAIAIVFYILAKGVEVIKNNELSFTAKTIRIILLYVVTPIGLFLFINP